MTTPKRTTTPPEGKLAQVLTVLEANTTLLAFFFGVCFVATLLVLAIWFPNPTIFQYTVFRITLALAVAGVAGVIPGMIRLKVQPGAALLIHAGGALAVFVMVYLFAPAKLPTEQSAPPIKEKSVMLEAPQLSASNTADASEEMSAVLNTIKIGQYLDNRDGTITDTQTGLMWKRCSEGLSGVNCEEGKAKKYTWDDAIKRFKNVGYAGHADWRLPTIDELKTLVYCSDGFKNKNNDRCNDRSEKPTINQQAFPNIQSEWYWSGSPDADSAWYVNFNYGYSYADNRNGNCAVRLVRSRQRVSPAKLSTEQPASSSPPPTDKPAILNPIKIGQYLDNRDGTITDTQTGLMWKRCSEGLSGVNCEEGKAKKYTWDDAIKRFNNVGYAGHADWRLPSIDELKKLVYCSYGVRKRDNGRCNNGSERPTINPQAFPNTKEWHYWSRSPYADFSDSAWYVYFSSGFSGAYYRYNLYAVRLVRGRQ